MAEDAGLKSRKAPRASGVQIPLSRFLFLDPIMLLDLVLPEEVWLIKKIL